MSGSKDSAQGSIASGNVPRPERIVEPQDDDYTSSSGSDTDSDDSPSEDDEASPEPNGRSSIPSSSTIPTIRTQPRPNIGAFKDLAGASDLRARLSSFLPKLKEANAQLEGEDEEALKKRRIEIFAVEDKEDEDEMDGVEHEEEQVENDGKQYIEMVSSNCFWYFWTCVLISRDY